MGSQPKQTAGSLPIGSTSEITPEKFRNGARTPLAALQTNSPDENHVVGIVNETSQPARCLVGNKVTFLQAGETIILTVASDSMLRINSDIEFVFGTDEVEVQDARAQVAGLGDHGELTPNSDLTLEVDYAFALVPVGEGDSA